MPGNDDNCLKMLQHQHEAALSCKKHINNLDKTTKKKIIEPNLPSQIYETKSNLPEQFYPNKPNNHTYQTKHGATSVHMTKHL